MKMAARALNLFELDLRRTTLAVELTECFAMRQLLHIQFEVDTVARGVCEDLQRQLLAIKRNARRTGLRPPLRPDFCPQVDQPAKQVVTHWIYAVERISCYGHGAESALHPLRHEAD